MTLTIGTTPALARSMTFERLTLDAVNRAITVEQYAAGKSVNVARVLHTLGKPVLATGTVGGDTGRFLCGDLSRIGVAHDFVEVSAPTRLCITVIDRQRAHATELVEETAPVSPAELAGLLSKLSTLIPRAKLLVLSGTLAPGVPEDFYAHCCRIAREHRVRTIVDARGPALLHCLDEHPHVIKPNRAEMDAPFGAVDPRELARCTGGWVVVTDGEHPTRLHDSTRTWSVDIPAVKVVSAIGSGDATTAGIAAGIYDGLEMLDAVRWGIACGCANAMTSAAGHVAVSEVERLRGMISVREG